MVSIRTGFDSQNPHSFHTEPAALSMKKLRQPGGGGARL